MNIHTPTPLHYITSGQLLARNAEVLEARAVIDTETAVTHYELNFGLQVVDKDPQYDRYVTNWQAVSEETFWQHTEQEAEYRELWGGVAHQYYEVLEND